MVGGPFGSDLVSNDYVDDGVPVIRGQNMGAKRVSGSFVFVSQEKARSLEANMARPGDVVFTQRGTLGQVSLIPDGPFERYLVSQSQMKVSLNRAAVDPEFFYYLFTGPAQQEAIRLNTIQTGVPHINLGILASIPVALPDLSEQWLIAGALSDADALIESLEQLLAKKRHLKQGAMQELLTGKKRLPGFADPWVVTSLGEIARIKTGSRNNQDKVEDGRYPFFVRSATIERINSYSHDCDAILVPGEGGIGNIFHFVSGRFDVHQRVYAIAAFSNETSPRFVYFYMATHFGAHAMANSVKATVDSLRLPTFQNFEMTIPPTAGEQTAIALVLSDMDDEVAALEAKQTKARQIKQGMMQELLTGRIRLV